ncbi:2'-5' RNA ligase family protein [Peredibacter starrii]|uniref:2'-5' RNA ligase family protein n=1 Tax=Peredibacter starrii TaxID=28202 RepID=A0AAX4HJW7_9BACT|nr:2'-5' RNA ligase family protein [Peredibacter starrii]WPU63539.1 2'-5' RNA ligase family protein [Peredibacter starrii]
MKFFLGLDVSELKLDLKKLKVNLSKGKNFEFQWLPEDQRFVPLIGLEEMEDNLLRQIAEETSIFTLKFEGMSAYPEPKKARLLWVGVQNSKEVRALFDRIVETLKIQPESEFKPYLPVVRLRNHREVSDLLSPHKNTDFGKFTISRLVLYEMTSVGAFPTYAKRGEYPLKVE